MRYFKNGYELLTEAKRVSSMKKELLKDETPSVDTLVAWFGKDKIAKNVLEDLGYGTKDVFDPENLISSDRISELGGKVKESLTKQKAGLEKQFNDMFTDSILKDPEQALKQYPKQLLDQILTSDNKKALERKYSRNNYDDDADADDILKSLCRFLYLILGDSVGDDDKRFIGPKTYTYGEIEKGSLPDMSQIDKKGNASESMKSFLEGIAKSATEFEKDLASGKFDEDKLEEWVSDLKNRINKTGMDFENKKFLTKLKNNMLKLYDKDVYKELLNMRKAE